MNTINVSLLKKWNKYFAFLVLYSEVQQHEFWHPFLKAIDFAFHAVLSTNFVQRCKRSVRQPM